MRPRGLAPPIMGGYLHARRAHMTPVTIPTEPIGSIPRPLRLLQAIAAGHPAGEPDRVRVLKIIRDQLQPDQRVFVGVVAPIDPRVETPEEVCERVLAAARYIPVEQPGTTDD